MSNNNSKISIITVVLNNAVELQKTIQSIKSQTYKNIEFIVIDGQSTDNTLNIITNEPFISNWISEADKGLFDAMNKGINIAGGDYIMFLNAGDEFYDKDTLKKVFELEKADLYYGETAFLDDKNNIIGTRSDLSTKKLPENLSKKDMLNGMVVCHQSIIVSQKIIPQYNINYKISADIDWVINCLENAKTVKNTNTIISKFQTQSIGKFYAGGMSSKYLSKSLKERFRIIRIHFGFFKAITVHIKLLFIALKK